MEMTPPTPHMHGDHVCWGHAHEPHRPHQLAVQGVAVSYREVRALEDISFQTECGRTVALVGPNGAGKSSLLKAMAGVIRPDAGEIFWRGQPLLAAHQEIAYLPQRGEIDWQFPITVRGLVEMGSYAQLGNWRRFREHDREIVNKSLEAMELKDLAERHISALSGGQQQRTFIARALAQEAHVLLLDEPFTGLDTPAQEMLQRLFRSLAAEGRLLIASHHDLSTVPNIFDEVLLVRKRQFAFGPITEAFTEANIATTYQKSTS